MFFKGTTPVNPILSVAVILIAMLALSRAVLRMAMQLALIGIAVLLVWALVYMLVTRWKKGR